MSSNTIRTHHIKITKHHFDAVLDGTKRAEIRKNDREYQKGDIIYLEEVEFEMKDGQFVSTTPKHTGRVIKAAVGYVTNYMQKEDVVVISIIVLPSDQEMLDGFTAAGNADSKGKRADAGNRKKAAGKRSSKKRK